MNDVLARIRSTADYQFGRGIGASLFPDNVKILLSKRTGRIRYVYVKSERLATLRPTDGLFSLSISGARRIVENTRSAHCILMVQNQVAQFIREGGDVFAAHVIKVDDEIRSKDEVIVVNETRDVLAVGRAVLSAAEMKVFKRGVAVKVRRGSADES